MEVPQMNRKLIVGASLGVVIALGLSPLNAKPG